MEATEYPVPKRAPTSSPRRPATNIFLIGALVSAVGCSGGGSAAPGPLPKMPVGSAGGASVARVSFNLGTTASKTSAAHLLYLSRGMKSLAIVVHSTGSPDARTVYDCASACNGGFDAPLGQDTFAITTYDGPLGTGNALSSGLSSLDVRVGIANQFSAVLGGIVAKLALSIAPAGFTMGVPATGTLAVVPLDASGNTIVGPDAFAAPVVISLANGAFSLGSSVISDPSKSSIPISYSGALFSAPATVTATAAGLDIASIPLMFVAASAGGASSGVSGRTVSAAGFVDSIGIATHFNYNGTPYTSNEPTVVSDIVDLHIKHIREGMLYPFTSQPATLQAAVRALSAAGVRDLAGPQASDLTAVDFASRWSTYYDSVGGSAWIEATEAPNECDLNGCLALAPSYQQKLYATVKGYAPSRGVSVYGPSFANASAYPSTGNLAQYLDAGNVHLYTLSQPPETTGICRVSDRCAGGASLGSLIGNTPSLDSLLQADAVVSGAKPIVDTESGICTTVDGSGNTRYNNVSRDVQAAYWPRFLLHAFGDLGVPRTYIYELADDGISAPDFDQCGLIDRSAVAKPSYRVLKTILDAVDDPGPSFVPSPLSFSIAAPTNVDGNPVSSMALAARNGAYTIFAWNPVSLFYQQSGNGGDLSHPLAVAPLSGTLTLGKTFSSAQVTTFDLATGNATTTAVDPSKPIALSITPSVTMIALRP